MQVIKNRDRAGRIAATHGHADKKIYMTWRSMKRRCIEPSNQQFSKYGGRGITVCDEWLDSFETFLRDMGEKPAGTSLDRINNDLGYFPANCRWATPFEQQNNKRSNRRFTVNGQTKTLAEWARELGITAEALANRISKGWDQECALTLPKTNCWHTPHNPRPK